MILSLIVAMDSHRAIGGDNRLLWHLPDDLKRFRALTTGHTILMGRKTWESLPNGALPNRRNVVVSRTLGQTKGAEVYASLDEALGALEAEGEVFVIGGGEIYRQTLERAQRLYITEVHGTFPEADTFFPELRAREWREEERHHHPRDERNAYDSDFVVLTRVQD